VAVANTVGVPERLRPGVGRHKLLLEVGIVLLGTRLTLGELVDTGPTVVALACAVVVFGVLYVELVVGRLLSVGGRTRSLLAAGASVCGVSAVLAVAGCLDADDVDITYAAATVLAFDAVTLVVFPALAPLLGLTGKQFGIWAGLSLFSTGPTAAVGFAVSETAGRWATVTKLVRNSFIGVLAVGYALRRSSPSTDVGIGRVWTRFPKFLVGFALVAVAVNLAEPSAGTLATVDRLGDWLFALAFVGLGLDIDLDAFRATGAAPVLVVLLHLLTVGGIALALVSLLF
jgi:uncharacterized integral membrane protein (TIGR00698 family)